MLPLSQFIYLPNQLNSAKIKVHYQQALTEGSRKILLLLNNNHSIDILKTFFLFIKVIHLNCRNSENSANYKMKSKISRKLLLRDNAVNSLRYSLSALFLRTHL